MLQKNKVLMENNFLSKWLSRGHEEEAETDGNARSFRELIFGF